MFNAKPRSRHHAQRNARPDRLRQRLCSEEPWPTPRRAFSNRPFPDAKAYDQVNPGNLTLKGFVVLAFDPLGQGERLQGYDPNTGMSLAAEGVVQHLMAGGQSLLMGQKFARYEIFDARRAIDYLMTRPDVDANRIGATGCSGGARSRRMPQC